MLYDALNDKVLAKVPLAAARILDLGCGTGILGLAIKQRQNCHLTGVTHNKAEAELAAIVLENVIVSDLNEFDPTQFGQFDLVICSHVLEHLYSPQDLLNRVRGCLLPGGEMLIALPNALFWRQRLKFLGGSFRYTESGLMDATHFRFYDWRTAQDLIAGCGYSFSAVADGYLPFSWLFPPFQHRLNTIACRLWPGIFGHQFLFSCRITELAGAQ